MWSSIFPRTENKERITYYLYKNNKACFKITTNITENKLGSDILALWLFLLASRQRENGSFYFFPHSQKKGLLAKMSQRLLFSISTMYSKAGGDILS